MIKRSYAKKIVSLLIATIMIATCTTSFGVWWGTPGYEWALANRLTSVKSTNQLKQNVTLSDFYTTIIKYLKLKGIEPRDETIHHSDDMDGIDNVAKGIFNIINSYNTKESLTIQQFYIVENYVEHAKETLEDCIDYSQYLTRNSLKNIQLYLDLSKYRAATLIGSRSDREYALARLGPLKNSEIINYNMLPYAADITRKEFLVVMHDLISTSELSEDAVIKAFEDAGVLVGFETGLELDKKITYSEMLTFLYRFEIFDFESNSTIDDSADDTEE